MAQMPHFIVEYTVELGLWTMIKLKMLGLNKQDLLHEVMKKETKRLEAITVDYVGNYTGDE